VTINANINTIVTEVIFEDSSSNYASSNTFYGGTKLSFQIDPNTTISMIKNTLVLTVDITSSSLFGELGTFEIKSAALELITSPVIDSESVKTSLPMEHSRGSWYIAPLTTLNVRKFESKLFTDIMENLYLRLDIIVSPSDYSLGSTTFKVLAGSNVYEGSSSESNPMQGTVYTDLSKGASLVLEFSFRPTSDLSNTIIYLKIEVEATPVTIIPDDGPSGPGENSDNFDLDFLGLAISDLELLRFSMIIIPLFLYFNRSKKQKKEQKMDYSLKGDLFGTNEK
ncbi:MAG: hypothetical protein ACFFG0_21525, partial [Candidatus Thorarchaeota archaeon]